jgi:ferrous iron transport protein B
VDAELASTAGGGTADSEVRRNVPGRDLMVRDVVVRAMSASPGYTIALAGNPNAGKTTVFNRLTGSRQHTGNWPGKTIERKSGLYKHADTLFEVVDLPGTYSLAAYSEEEIVARDYLLGGEADLVVVVVDASNLERNLYLVVQILEMQVPMLVALNMTDMADTQGIEIDVENLSNELGGIPIIKMVAARGRGIESLQGAILNSMKTSFNERLLDPSV